MLADTLDLLVRNGMLVRGGGRLAADIGVSGGRIVAVEPPGTLDEPAAEVVDATGLLILPGVIDGHVHFREPGLERAETWLTGSRAAVFGGVTTVLEMPNTVPPTGTVERARGKLALATRSSYCDFGVFGLLGSQPEAIEELLESRLVVGLKCFLGPTTGGLAAPDDEGLRRALQSAREHGVRVAFHAEDPALIAEREAELRAAGRIDARAHLEARPAAAEVAAIDRAGRLLTETGAQGHILHVSSVAGVDAVARWRARGLDLMCETTPHHSLLDESAYDLGPWVRANPPFRGGDDAAALRAALADGRIDAIASDHAPHALADKRHDSIWDVPSGLPGVEILLPLLLTEVVAGRLTLERLVAVTSEGPARTWGLWPRKGALEVGSDADVVLVDPDRPGEVRAASLHGLTNETPFEGRATVGAPVTTIVRGRIIVRDATLFGRPGWGRNVIDENDQAPRGG